MRSSDQFSIACVSSEQLNIQHSKLNIAVGIVPMLSVKCLMLNSWIIRDRKNTQQA